MKNTGKSFICFFLLLFFASASPAFALMKANVPCYLKVAAGDELRISIDTNRKAELIIKNTGGNESEFVVMEYRNGKPRKGFKAESTSLNKSNYSKDWRFNRYFDQTPASLLVDEVRIKVNKGAIYAELGQSGDDRIDFFNYGYQRGISLNPKKPLTVQITGDANRTSGFFWMECEGGTRSNKIAFNIKKDQTQTWDYPADKKITDFEIDVTQGQARISLFLSSPSKNTVSKKPSIKEPKQQKNTASSSKTRKDRTAVTSDTAVKSGPDGTILNGEAPCINGAKVIKSISRGVQSRTDLETQATPEEVVHFYKQAMTAKGWQVVVNMVQGPKGVLQLVKGKSQIAITVRSKGQKTIVKLILVKRK